MIKPRLGVNIDHVATIRNARGEKYPEPEKAALLAQLSGADSITIHLREDRRHINDSDLKKIKKKIKIPLNLEMAPTNEMLKIAIKNKPNYMLGNEEVVKALSTVVDPKTGKISSRKPTFTDLKKLNLSEDYLRLFNKYAKRYYQYKVSYL